MTAKSAYAKDYESAQKLGVLGIEVVKAPKHATYEIRTTYIDENGKTVPMVYPEYSLVEWDGYLGADRAEFLVKLNNGKTVLVVYDIFWTNQPTDSFNQCPPTKLQYKQMRELQRRERAGYQDDGSFKAFLSKFRLEDQAVNIANWLNGKVRSL